MAEHASAEQGFCKAEGQGKANATSVRPSLTVKSSWFESQRTPLENSSHHSTCIGGPRPSSHLILRALYHVFRVGGHHPCPRPASCPARVLIDDFHHIRHLTAPPPPRFVCLGAPLATCALPKGVCYLLTYYSPCVGIPTPVAARERRAWHLNVCAPGAHRWAILRRRTKRVQTVGRGVEPQRRKRQVSQGSRKLTSTTMNGESMRHPVSCIDSHWYDVERARGGALNRAVSYTRGRNRRRAACARSLVRDTCLVNLNRRDAVSTLAEGVLSTVPDGRVVRLRRFR